MNRLLLLCMLLLAAIVGWKMYDEAGTRTYPGTICNLQSDVSSDNVNVGICYGLSQYTVVVMTNDELDRRDLHKGNTVRVRIARNGSTRIN